MIANRTESSKMLGPSAFGLIVIEKKYSPPEYDRGSSVLEESVSVIDGAIAYRRLSLVCPGRAISSSQLIVVVGMPLWYLACRSLI
jgi:hypothetical protein